MFTFKKNSMWFACLLLSCCAASANALVVLQYHHISNDTPKATSLSPVLFEQHLDYLAENDFDVIGLDQLARLIREGESLPDKTAVITFDDGYISVYRESYPRLKKRGFPFAVFINTQPHDQGNSQFMSWQQMQKMADDGVVFANHSVSHPHMIRREQGENQKQWRDRVTQEIDAAEETIRQQLQQSHKLFAYPFGEFNWELQNLLAQQGYLAFGQQSGPLGKGDNPQALPRFPFGGSYGDMNDFATKVNTRPMPFKRVQAQNEAGVPLIEPELPKDMSRPRLTMNLKDEVSPSQVNCFASGQGRIPTKTEDDYLVAQAPKALPVGRSRYNCTAATGEKERFYWFSVMFIRRLPDGSWYAE